MMRWNETSGGRAAGGADLALSERRFFGLEVGMVRLDGGKGESGVR